MKRYLKDNILCGKIKIGIIIFPLLWILASCASLDPRNTHVELKKGLPEKKVTSFSETLVQMGKMTEIYQTNVLKIQSKTVVDDTGTSKATGGEIPRDITEMIKSTLNAIGGQIIYIPYHPAFMQNQMVTGYSSFDNKFIPDVVISGGITEFDRGLETRGKNTDFGVESKPIENNVPSWAPGDTVGLDYSKAGK